MMKVKITKTIKGAEDGIHVKEYISGEVYDIQEKLAKIIVGLGSGEFVPDIPAQKKVEVPENKKVELPKAELKEQKDKKEKEK